MNWKSCLNIIGCVIFVVSCSIIGALEIPTFLRFIILVVCGVTFFAGSAIISDKIQTYEDKLCPICKQGTLEFVESWLYFGPSDVSQPTYYLCEACGAQIVRYAGGEWKVATDKEWEIMEDRKRSNRMLDAPHYQDGKAVNEGGDEVTGYQIVDEKRIVLVWFLQDIQAISSYMFYAPYNMAEVLDAIKQASTPEILVNEDELQHWIKQWNQDPELLKCLVKSPNIGEDFTGTPITFTVSSFELYYRNLKSIACLWRLYTDNEVRQKVQSLAVWNELSWYASKG